MGELYFGRKKTMKITRKRLNADNNSLRTDSKMITIEIKKGWKEGTKITFNGEGDENINMTPGDMQFIIKQKKHDLFERAGNDLIRTINISLKQALCGVNVNVLTLDKRRLKIPITENTISPGYIHRVQGEGMPISKTDGHQRGDLFIKFNIKFPENSMNDKRMQYDKTCKLCYLCTIFYICLFFECILFQPISMNFDGHYIWLKVYHLI